MYPWLGKADTKHDASGVFHTDLSMPPELAQEFIAKLEQVRENFLNTLAAAQQIALQPRPVFTEEVLHVVEGEILRIAPACDELVGAEIFEKCAVDEPVELWAALAEDEVAGVEDVDHLSGERNRFLGVQLPNALEVVD